AVLPAAPLRLPRRGDRRPRARTPVRHGAAAARDDEHRRRADRVVRTGDARVVDDARTRLPGGEPLAPCEACARRAPVRVPRLPCAPRAPVRQWDVYTFV